MDNYEATKTILAKIQSMDPDNASKIMGYILIQDLGDKEMIRLALGPDSLLVTLMNQAKTCLGLGGLGLSPNNHNHSNRHNPFSQTTPRILIPNNNGFHPQNHHFPSSPSPTSPWSSNAAAFSMNSPRPASYASVVNGGPTNGGNGASGSSSSSLSLPFYGLNTNNNTINNNNSSELNDEFVGNLQFLDDSLENQHQHHHHPLMSPSGRSDSMIFPYGNSEDPSQHPQLHHRRSFSVNDVFLGGGNGVEDGGVGGGGGNGFAWRPCMYYARGFCKNGSSCKFLHGGIDSPDGGVSVGGGSPTKISDGGYDDFLRMKAIQQQRLVAAASLMASNAGQHPFPYNNNKALTFLNENQRSAAAAMMMSEEFHKFNRFRPDRMNFSGMGLDGPANSTSRQIYLTFPADSTFKEEDVSNYFGMYGPVQDVRIPYQQKRMFGFVTFVYPETVKLILAKGNPHFVCDSRVLVKPYKEKGKVVEKKHHQQQQLVDQGEFPGCLSPTAFDSQESYDLPFGAGMFFNTQEMMLRRKFEERAELQQAIDLQGRRLMNMQMMELQQNHNNHAQFMPTLSPPIPPHHNLMFLPQEGINVELQEGINTSQEVVVNSPKETQEATESPKKEDDDATNNLKDSEFNESLEHNLPDNLFASPTKSSENRSLFAEAFNNETADNNSNNNKSVSPLQTCNFQSPRFSSSQEAIKM